MREEAMRVAILTSGRFWVGELARELAALGHEVRFYSCVPARKTREFRLPDRCNRCLLWRLVPGLVAWRAFRATRLQYWSDAWLAGALDRAAARLLEPCDVLIGMSGMSTLTARTAREKYGAKVFIERGSRHILSQDEILQRVHGRRRLPEFTLRRELSDYQLADVIVIPSQHVERSFLERGVPSERLFRNPYGVDLKEFHPTPAPSPDPPTVLMTGTWSLRKGCDVLVEAWRRLKGVRLMHVGPVEDCRLPEDGNFEHHGPVRASRLKDFYAQGHVFALASREEGLALVQAQALACGLPLVCTDRTGGEDLRAFVDDPALIRVVPPDDPRALADGLQEALDRARRTAGPRDLLGRGRERLSWPAYAERYDRFLRERVGS